MKLAKMTGKEAQERILKTPIAVFGVGSIEMHGKHAPMGTDYMIPDYIIDKISEREDILVLPTIPYGVCPTISDYPGTIDIGHDNLVNIMNSIINSLKKFGIKKFIIINGHGGNISAIDRVGTNVYKEGGLLANIDWWLLAKQLNKDYDGGHGDIQETSVAMAIDKSSVNLDYCESPILNHLSDSIKNQYISAHIFKEGSVKIIRSLSDVCPNGWIGPYDPKNSTAELGGRILRDVIQYINDFIDEFQKI